MKNQKKLPLSVSQLPPSLFWITLLLIPLLVISFLFPHFPYHWDEIQFLLATQHYNVALHQPHPPGYILFVLMGKAMQVFVSDPYRAFQWVSLLHLPFAILFFYLLAKEWRVPHPLLATLFFGFSALLLFHALLGFSYLAEAAWAELFVLCAKRNRFLAASFALAMLGAIRQSGLVFLLPLYFYFLFKTDPADRVLGVLIAAIVFGSFFYAMASSSGGIQVYRHTLSRQFQTVVLPASVWADPLLPFRHLLTALALLVVSSPFFLLAPFSRNPVLSPEPPFLLYLWIAPALLFHLLFHMNNPGYLLILYPPLCLALSRRIVLPLTTKIWVALPLFLFQMLLFLILPTPISYPILRQHDQNLQWFQERVNHDFPRACILTRNYFYYGFRHAHYLFPNRPVLESNPKAFFYRGLICDEELDISCPPLPKILDLCPQWVTLQDPADAPWQPSFAQLRWKRYGKKDFFFYASEEKQKREQKQPYFFAP